MILDGRKTIETRSWSTRHRGPVAIHAGKTVDKKACDEFSYDPRTIPTGVILCTANIAGVVKFPSPRAPPDEFGDFSTGRYGWLLVNVTPLDPPVPAKGQLGLWNWGDKETPVSQLGLENWIDKGKGRFKGSL